MIKMYKWRKDLDTAVVDRWIMPLIKESKEFKCIDFQYDAYGSREFMIIDRKFDWLEKHTKEVSYESVYVESGIDETNIITYIFEDLQGDL